MLDINYIKENLKEIKKAAKNKKIDVDLDKLLKLDEKRRQLIKETDELRQKRNEIAESLKDSKKRTPKIIAEGKTIKDKIIALENDLNNVSAEFEELMVKVPTIPSEDTPIGKSDKDNVEVYKWGEPRKFDFKTKDYMELAADLNLIDFDRGAKVAGYRGYYVKNEAVLLQMGLMMYALSKLVAKGFTPIIPPTLVKEFVLFGSGYFAGKNYNPETDEIYKIANDEKLADGTLKKEGKFLIGTAEPSLLSYYADEVLEEKELPIRFVGFCQCYRSEIGSYGKDTKGIYRVHEFMKVEQVCLTKADIKESDKMHQEMISISKELHEDLKLPYRQIQICTGDMSAGKYKMFDLEAWIPSRNGYGETGSASNFLDWQSRRLNVRYKDKEGNKKFVHMINNTAIPSPRFLIAIIENYQNADGSITIPEVLRPYLNNQEKISPAK
ncbi:MAG: serine--tRNA ligase [Candidatus Buchananbacteria bacterium RBG_13_36_9]|uniref:Serine--tRNA ligase n=1 Tax=Candidatus Buchananbacteria bacterium RBG_13_36_9 TaxID=1797530 RepID=A0A1G1XQM2_9BACT|nr:MAG: serine--tRNA ligase [Candidatus Buchananbacteria bacterium RBG_13_36_9]